MFLFLDYNIAAEALINKSQDSNSLSLSRCTDVSNDTTNTSIRSSRSNDTASSIAQESFAVAEVVDKTYQNYDFSIRNSMYSNRETILCDDKLPSTSHTNILNNNNAPDPKAEYYNFPAVSIENTTSSHYPVERSQSMKLSCANAEDNNTTTHQHIRTQSLIEQRISSSAKKIPDNLNLNPHFVDNSEPSPALSTSSGPYIPISECFTGSPLFLENENPSTPLNSLDPKFYDTPTRIHNNIGLNLTNEQPYSPKRNNLPVSTKQFCLFV